MTTTQHLRWLTPLCAVLMAPQLSAAPVSVTTRAAIGANGLFDWASVGLEYDSLGSSFGAASPSGLGATISGATQSVNGFERADQSSSWLGNFAPDDALLWTGFGFDTQVISIEFNVGVLGAGAQIQNDFPGPFDAFLNVYDTGGILIHSDLFSGDSTPDEDNSAIFIGVLNDVPNIGRLEFGMVIDGYSFAINQLDVNHPAIIPEASTYLAMLSLAGLVGTRVWMKRRAAL